MDKYAELRATLEIGPTPGPWIVHGSLGYAVATVGKIRIATNELHINIRPGDDAEYIAACHPEAIRALLAERDALREALTGITEKSSLVQSAADEIDRLRAALADMLDMYGGTRDCEGRRKDDYEMERINSAYAALTQQEQS